MFSAVIKLAIASFFTVFLSVFVFVLYLCSDDYPPFSIPEDPVKAAAYKIQILGFDKDGNGVRDDLDSLIDAKIPDNPEQRAAYRYIAKAIQDQWVAFCENPKMTYEEFFPYEIYTSLGIGFIHETHASEILKFEYFHSALVNTKDRKMLNYQLDGIFDGHIVPAAVKRDKRYVKEVAEGTKIYNEFLIKEKLKLQR